MISEVNWTRPLKWTVVIFPFGKQISIWQGVTFLSIWALQVMWYVAPESSIQSDEVWQSKRQIDVTEEQYIPDWGGSAVKDVWDWFSKVNSCWYCSADKVLERETERGGLSFSATACSPDWRMMSHISLNLSHKLVIVVENFENLLAPVLFLGGNPIKW